MTSERPVVEGSQEFDDLSVRAWLRLGWRGFNRWRKRYWLTRVIILLLIFSPASAEMLHPQGLLITRLVRIAVEAIQVSSEPRLAYNLARFYRFEEADRLRLSLWRELDTNQDGALDEAEKARVLAAGLDAAQLTCPIIQADIEQLASAARRLGLLPEPYSLADVYSQTWLAGQAEADRLMAPSHQGIEALLRTREERLNYLEWETWNRGLVVFAGRLWAVFGLPTGWLVAFLVCFLVGGIGSLAVAQRRPAAGFCCAALMAAVVPRAYSGWLPLGWEWLEWTGYVLLAGAVGYVGGKAAGHVTHRPRVALAAIASVGPVLTLRGVTPRLDYRIMCWFHGIRFPSDWGPPLVNLGWIAAGLTLALTGAVGLYLLSRRRAALL